MEVTVLIGKKRKNEEDLIPDVEEFENYEGLADDEFDDDDIIDEPEEVDND